jgi:hypothetical protein
VLLVGQDVEQYAGAAGVGVDVARDFVHGLAHTDLGGQVHDLIHPGDGLDDLVALAHVSLNELDVGRNELGALAAVHLFDELVVYDDLMVLALQQLDDV